MANELITPRQAAEYMLAAIEKTSKETGVPIAVVGQMAVSMIARAHGFPFDPLLDGGLPC